MLLTNQSALITGAGRGIGQAIAVAFAEQGCDVALVARTASELEETRARVEATGRRGVPIVCDVTGEAQVAAMATSALDAFGKIDILVNNAGYGRFKPFMEQTLDEFDRTMSVNVRGVFLCSRAVLPSMIARRSGRIINMSSVSGLRPIAEQAAYCASKHAVNGLTVTMALELREHNIRVHAICPGGVPTRLTEENMPQRDKTGWMTPEDVAHTALYLASLSDTATTDIIYLRRFGSVPLGG